METTDKERSTEIKEWIAAQIGEGVHTSLRKFCDSEAACRAHSEIRRMPDAEWANVCDLVASECMRKVAPLFAEIETAGEERRVNQAITKLRVARDCTTAAGIQPATIRRYLNEGLDLLAVPRDKAGDRIVAHSAPLTPAQGGDTEAPWCQPRDDQQRKWVLFYEDVDRSMDVFEYESEARRAYEQARCAYSCHLFTSVAYHEPTYADDGDAHAQHGLPSAAPERAALPPMSELDPDGPLYELAKLREAFGVLSALFLRVREERDTLRERDTCDEWVEPEWQALESYPRHANTPVKAWFWHDSLGLMHGYICELPSGTRVGIEPSHAGTVGIHSHADARYRGLRYWKPKAPAPGRPSE